MTEEIKVIQKLFNQNNFNTYTGDIHEDIKTYIQQLLIDVSKFETNYFKYKMFCKLRFTSPKHIVEQMRSNKIDDVVMLNKKFFIGRTGFNGWDCILPFLYLIDHTLINKIINNKSICNELRKMSHNQAGIYDTNDERYIHTLKVYLKMYTVSIKNCTHFKTIVSSMDLAQYYFSLDKQFVYDLNFEFKNFEIHNTNNTKYHTKKSWIEFFKGKKLLFITSFPETAQNQLIKGNVHKMFDLNPNERTFDIDYCKSPVSFCGNTPDSNILESFEKLKNSVTSKEFDIAIIGCGGYSMLIGDYIYTEMNRSALVTGGTIQLWFGIKGSRWNTCDIYNEYWCNVLSEELPQNANLVENGCYF